MAREVNRAPLWSIGTRVRVRTGLRRGRVGIVEAHAEASARGIATTVVVVAFEGNVRGSYFPDEVEAIP